MHALASAVIGLAILVAGLPAAAQGTFRFAYQDLPVRSGVPAPEFTLLGSVLGDEQAAVRRHAWDLWAGLTTPSDSVVDGQRLPIFQTWYSIPEVYNPRGRAGVERRAFRHPFKVATQAAIANGARGGAPAGVM